MQDVTTYYDYAAVFLLYVTSLLFMYLVRNALMLSKVSQSWSRFIAGASTWLVATLLYITRSLWLSSLPSYLDKNLILEVMGTIWWLSLGHSAIHALEVFVWSGIYTRQGQLVVPKILTDLLRIFIVAASAVFTLHYVYGQPITGVLATSGVLAIVIGYSAQSSLSHIFAGLALNLNPCFTKGDYVEIDGRWGRIIDMSWRYVTIQDFEENYVTLPNSAVSNATIKNFMHPTPRRGVVIYVTIPLHMPPERVKEVLYHATKSSPNVLEDDGGPWVTLWEFTEHGARYQIYFYTTLPFNYSVRDEVFSAVWYSLQRHGIPIATTHHEVTVQRPRLPEKVDYTDAFFTLLQDLPLFHALREDELHEIAAGAVRLVYGPPECIIREHDTGSSVFIVAQGLLDVYVQQSDQNSIKVAQIGPGSIFGEMAFLTGEPRAATIRAASAVTVYEIGKYTLQPILEKRPELIEELSRLLATRHLESEMKSSAYKMEQAMQEKTVDSIASRIASSIRAFFHPDC